MKRALKWLLPVLIFAETMLVWSGALDLSGAVLVVVGIEALIVATGIGEILLVTRRYRRGRAEGLDVWAALEEGLAVMLPRPAARLAVSEPRLLFCLARWAFGKARPGEGEYGYHKRSSMGPLLLMVVLTAPVELLVFELLIPWAWLRWLLLILGIYAIVWVFGFYASLVTLPHRLEDDGIRLRYGAFAEVFVPYSNIESIERKRRKSPRTGDGLQTTPDGDAAYLAMGSTTELTLKLRQPLAVNGFLRGTTPVLTIHAATDEPKKMARELERRLREAAEEEQPRDTSPLVAPQRASGD